MISESTNVLQQGPALCLSLLPASSHRDLIASLICGIPLSSGEVKQVFLDTGLIHLMVVSGAHLLFLESLVARAPLRWRLGLLGLYCWLTGFGAPVVKAFLRRAAEVLLRPLGWSGLQIEAVAVLLSLFCYPWWLNSRSLQMSWMCGLALSLPPILRWRAFDQALKAYLLLFIFVGSSVVSIGWNTLVAPIVGAILFPISLALLILPFLAPWVDLVWDLFLWLLAWGPKSPPAAWFISSRDLFWVPFFLHIFLLTREIRWRRAFAFSL
jgi:predicted membrane metal-binding protein